MQPHPADLYVGLSGVHIGPSSYDLGGGASVCQTYVHVMAHFLAAFERPRRGEAHPAPWVPAGAAITRDVEIQLEIDGSVVADKVFDQDWAAWWILTLLRLRVGPQITAPVACNVPFQQLRSKNSGYLRPLEIYDDPLIPEREPRREIVEADLAWVSAHWRDAASVGAAQPDYRTVVQAFHYATHAPNVSLVLLSLWALLEQVFSPSHTELRFRISALIAAYLEEPGEGRYVRQQTVAKLYDARSKAAHGVPNADWDSLIATYALAREVMTRIVEDGALPSKGGLEARLFGA